MQLEDIPQESRREIGDIPQGISVDDLVTSVMYTNWKGETRERRIIPLRVHYESTPWHPQQQWLLRAYDVEKKEVREFALNDIKGNNTYQKDA